MCAVEWKKLGDVCDFIRGPFGGALKKEMFVKEGYAIYEQQHAIYGDWVFRYFINDDKFHQLKRFEVKAGDILMSCSGTMGKTSIVPENPTKGIINQALLKLSVRDIATNKFVKAFMDSSWFQKGLGQNTSGGAIQNVASVSILKTLEIPIPSLAKQQEIVSHLDTFTTLISNLESELDMRRKQYEHYRNQLLDFEGVEGVEWKTLGEVCDFIRGPFGGALKKEMFVKEGYAIYEQQHAIYGDWIFRYFINDDKFHQMKRFEVKAGEILMSCSGTMGKTSIVPENPIKGIINQALLKLSVKEIATNKFVKAFMDSSWFQKGLSQNTSGGAIQNVASVSILKTLEIPVPSLKAQQEIVEKLDAFENLIQSLEHEIKLRKQQYEYYREKLLTFEKE